MHSCLCFSLLWKTGFKQSRQLLDTSWQLVYLLSPLIFFLSHSRYLLDRFSIHRETFCLLDRCSIVVQSIKVGFCMIATRQLLDLSRSSYMHYFSHVLHLSIILSSITFCFIIFMHFYGFLLPPWSSLIIFLFLGWDFLASCTLCQSWQKRGEIVEKMWFLFKILHVRGRNTCLCKGEMCFILLGGVLTSFFVYIGLVTMFTYIVLNFDIFIW